MKRGILFQASAYNEFIDWSEKNPKIFNKINTLFKDILRTPFIGLGNPEPLKFEKSGYWSRKITSEHRIVYEVKEEIIIIVSCMGHYT
jgi:toxin YoeB